MLNCNKKNNRGISMIEAVLAIAVLMIGVLSIINIFPVALKISRTSEQETVAANLAQAKIEEMFQSGYDNIAIGTIEAKHRLATAIDNPFYYYERQTEAIYVDGNLADSASPTGLKKITVTVYWTTPQLNIEKNLVVTILISQK
jgi:Tfp pilus assembly protein PilV